jgi:hypothetical protein|tara:strand:+ start:90 stop:386 length:297 start_codon:yes stop_codon:yes gene_type:complete
MPYIKENARLELDGCIDNMVDCLTHGNSVSNEEFAILLGEINYTFSRILAKSMGETSYSKIAMATGVLENIKQEFYRRIAASYEDEKIVENGDIKEYR